MWLLACGKMSVWFWGFWWRVRLRFVCASVAATAATTDVAVARLTRARIKLPHGGHLGQWINHTATDIARRACMQQQSQGMAMSPYTSRCATAMGGLIVGTCATTDTMLPVLLCGATLPGLQLRCVLLGCVHTQQG